MTKAQGRRSKKLAGNYERQFSVSVRNKERRAAKRRNRKAAWVKKGVKKNGKAVAP